MDAHRIILLLGKYDRALELRTILPPMRGDVTRPMQKAVLLAHCRWMCQSMIDRLRDVGDAALMKANRWLGFVQAVLVAEDIYTVSQLMDDNR